MFRCVFPPSAIYLCYDLGLAFLMAYQILICIRSINDFLFFVLHAGICFGHGLDIVIDVPPSKDVKGKTAIIPTADGGYAEVDVELAMTQQTPYFDIDNDVYFELYTRSNPEVPFHINMSDPDSLGQSPFNRKHPTRIAVHGWRSVGEMRELLVDGEFSDFLIIFLVLNIPCVESFFFLVLMCTSVHLIRMLLIWERDIWYDRHNLWIERIECLINDNQQFSAYFNRTNKEYNFIAVNWTEGASPFNYVTARWKVDIVSTPLEIYMSHGNIAQCIFPTSLDGTVCGTFCYLPHRPRQNGHRKCGADRA